jgi:transcriptional regulator with XRE-family HTH domain
VDPKSPDPVDMHVGARIRMRREDLRISQDTLSKAIGVTFQQVQKYERGQNRISASRLTRVARTLKTPIAWFFDGIEVDADKPAIEGEGADLFRRIVLSPGGQRLALAYLDLGAEDRGVALTVVERLAALAKPEGRA